MALFVAKLFDSAGGPGNKVNSLDQRDDIDNMSSPVAHSHYQRREPFSITLSRTLRRAYRASLMHVVLTEEFKSELSHVLVGQLERQKEVTVVYRWPADQVDVLRNIPVSESADPESILDESVAFLKKQIETERQTRLVAIEAEGRKCEILTAKFVQIYELGPSIYSSFSTLCKQIHGIETTIKSEHASIKKARFLESVRECVMITDSLNQYLESASIDENTEIFIDQLGLAAGMAESLIGRSREVIVSRISILSMRIVQRLISELKDDKPSQSMERRVRLFTMLNRFEHPDPSQALAVFFESKLRKFDYHFVRKSSQLNLVDRPEWPLRWLLDLAVETAKSLPVERHQSLGRFLARHAREYYNANRWGSIDNPRAVGQSDLFSLYLARYIHSTNQWAEVFGLDVLDELWLDVREGVQMSVGQWSLLEEWILHDKKHIDKAVESTKHPFKPSPYNGEVCSIVQMIEDVLGASRLRISCITPFEGVRMRFREECHDPTIEDFMYKVRVSAREGLAGNEASLIKYSIERLHRFLVDTDLCSPYIRRQLLDVSKFI